MKLLSPCAALGLLATASTAAPIELYDRDSPFNAGIKAPATPGDKDPADTHPGLNLIP